jgi:hypothetical protein
LTLQSKSQNAGFEKGDKLINLGVGVNSYYNGGIPIGASAADYNIDFDWNRNNAGDYHFDMQFDMGTTNMLHYIADVNNDMSGNFSYTVNGNLFYGCIWDSTGHGVFTDYNTTPPTVTTF